KDDLMRALAAGRRAEALVGNARSQPELRDQVAQVMANLRFLVNVQEIRLQRAAVKDNRFDSEAADRLYRTAFAEFGLPVLGLEPQEAAERIRQSAIATWLVSALDDWANSAPSRPADVQKLWAVARMVDRDPLRQQVREAIQGNNDAALVGLAEKQGI